MQIKALANATGVEVETIRFYEKNGLLPAPARRDNGYRDYGPEHLERLSFIRHCRALDMPLADIRLLLEAVHTHSPAAQSVHVDQLIDQQLAKVRARLVSMQALEKQLLRLRAACNGDHLHSTTAGCGILSELVSAAHGEACACHGNTA